MFSVACGSGSSCSPLQGKHASSLAIGQRRAIIPVPMRQLIVAGVACSGRTAENDHRPTVAQTFAGEPTASPIANAGVLNNVVATATGGRGLATTVDTSNVTARFAATQGASFEDDEFSFVRRAPAGIADRITAAAERHASHQLRHLLQQQQQSKLSQHDPLLHPPSPQRQSEVSSQQPEPCRLWESRLLSRGCQSLAFHISSHFHVPTGPTDPLASVLSFASTITSSPSPGSAGASSTSSLVSGLADPASLLGVPGPWTPALGTAAPLTTDDTGRPSSFDPHGVYDNLPAVLALKTLGSALVDPELWLQSTFTCSTSTFGGYTAPGTSVPPPLQSNGDSHVHVPSTLEPLYTGAPQAGNASFPAGDGSSAIDLPAHTEAPRAVNTLTQLLAGALVRLAHSCGHQGCYSIVGPPASTPAPAPSTTTTQSPRSGRTAPSSFGQQQQLGSSPVAAQDEARLAGLPFVGRQLARLYDMARGVDNVDPAALAELPAEVAAALLVLLAAAQPTSHAAVSGGPAPGPTRNAGAAPNTAVPAALLARYLRAGPGSRNPMDTVRVMWALLRLQLPGAGALLLPLEPDVGDGNSTSSSGDESDGCTYPPSTDPFPSAATGCDPMTQLARILSYQLRNRDHAMAVVRGARPGELYGTWQLAVQTLALAKDRLLVRERSEAALAQLDSALELLEAALAGSGPDAGGPGGPLLERGLGGVKAAPALQTPVVEALEAFLGLLREVTATRESAPSPPPVHDPFAMTPPAPAWDVVPGTDAEWRAVLGDTEQRVCLLLSTWPELGRLVVPAVTANGSPAAASATTPVTATGNNATTPTLAPTNSSPTSPTATPGPVVPPLRLAPSASSPGAASPTAAALGENEAPPAGSIGASSSSSSGGSGNPWSPRRLRLQLKPYLDLHFRTLELLYRALKAQAPDAQLLARLTPEEEDTTEPEAQLEPTVAPGAEAQPAPGGLSPRSAALSRRLLRAVALPHRAPVDMVYSDARGRRVGLCLAHLGASRRAPGELAVLQHAMHGWPEADMAAAQQGFRAARAAARAAAAAREAALRAQQAAAVDSDSVRFAVGVASATMGLMACTANMALASSSFDAEEAERGLAAAVGLPGPLTAAAEKAKLHGAGWADGVDGMSEVEEAMLEVVAAALEADAAAICAAPSAAASAIAQAAEAAATAAAALAPHPVSAFSASSSATLSGGRQPQLLMAHGDPVLDLDLDELLVLELDHDWFHLREDYYSAVSRQGKWSEAERAAIGAAMSYMELPWEAQLDMVWHVLAAAGAEPPIRVFA